ncbi:hypothetical protein CHS0354_002211 [Potamilus streckersoni]|uniref:Uncharacterized protein n=1 Tax=Potamilus streckersoni TaxID=2493646 RepID=A0AAE0RS50_9BIVA|nr:hypothetical protein CHS0354_002211 [Potamilus streckersoni]
MKRKYLLKLPLTISRGHVPHSRTELPMTEFQQPLPGLGSMIAFISFRTSWGLPVHPARFETYPYMEKAVVTLLSGHDRISPCMLHVNRFTA